MKACSELKGGERERNSMRMQMMLEKGGEGGGGGAGLWRIFVVDEWKLLCRNIF